MSNVFNGGMNGIICDKCKTLITTCLISKKTRKGNVVHYCSKKCENLHYNKPKNDKKILK